MKKLNKKVIATTLGAAFVFGAMGSVFAAEADTAATPTPAAAAVTTPGKPAKADKTAKLEAEAAEKGITVDELKAQKAAERGNGHGGGKRGGKDLEALAAEKGITVEDLKAQLDAERQAKLEAEAAEKGITVDELKAQKAAERGNGHGGKRGGKDLEALAAEKGITVEELKVQLDAERQAKLEAEAAEKGITVDELKAQKAAERGPRGGKHGGPRVEADAAAQAATPAQ